MVDMWQKVTGMRNVLDTLITVVGSRRLEVMTVGCR